MATAGLKITRLNVGGKIYTTTLDTLMKFPDSMLGGMFSGQVPSTLDEDGRYFIDANGEMFEYVLNYLRRNVLTLPQGFNNYKSLLAEAEFYQVQPMIDEIRALVSTKTAPSDEVAMLLCVRDGNQLIQKELVMKVYLRSSGSIKDAFEEADIEQGLDYQRYIKILQESGYRIKVGPRRFRTEDGNFAEVDEYLAWMHVQGLLRPPSPRIFMGQLFSKFDRYEIWGK